MLKIIGYLFNIKAEIKIQVRENDMRAVEVRLQNASMQAGIEKNPVIQWQYGEEDAGKRQSSYQIQILRKREKSVRTREKSILLSRIILRFRWN